MLSISIFMYPWFPFILQCEDKNSPNSLDIRKILLSLRQQRIGLVQTPQQYRFSFLAIITGLNRLFPTLFGSEASSRSFFYFKRETICNNSKKKLLKIDKLWGAFYTELKKLFLCIALFIHELIIFRIQSTLFKTTPVAQNLLDSSFFQL